MRFLKFTLIAILIMPAFLLGCSGNNINDGVMLRYNYESGEKFNYIVTMDTNFQVSDNGEELQPMNMKMNYNLEQEILNVDDNISTIKYTIKDMDLKLLVEGETFDVPNLFFPDIELVFIIDDVGKVLELKEGSNYDSIIPGSDMGIDFEQLIKQAQPQLPEKVIQPGYVWEQKVDLFLPDIGFEEAHKIDVLFNSYETINGQEAVKTTYDANIPIDFILNPKEEILEGEHIITTEIKGIQNISSKNYLDKDIGIPIKSFMEFDADLSMSITGRGEEQNIDMIMSGKIQIELIN